MLAELTIAAPSEGGNGRHGIQLTGAARRVAGAATLAVAMLATISSVAIGGTISRLRLEETGQTSQGWALTPAGVQTKVGAGPQAVAVSPNGSMVVVANAGYVGHSLEVIDPKTGTVTQTIAAKGGKSKHNCGSTRPATPTASTSASRSPPTAVSSTRRTHLAARSCGSPSTAAP